MSVRVVCLRCRTSDRTEGAGQGAETLARRLDPAARIVGSPGEPHAGDWADDLRDAHGCLLEAGGQVDDALDAGDFPVLTASDCSICLTTLPTVARQVPDARFLWLDAHGDFNTPATTPSGFLGGMCLAGACGRWDSGFEGTVDPARVVMAGVRDVDGGEQVELERAGVGRARPAQVAELLGGAPVYVHLDLDVLDPELFPAQFPAPHGLSDTGLRTLLAELAGTSELVGLELTAFQAPAEEAERDRLAELVASVIAPLLEGRS